MPASCTRLPPQGAPIRSKSTLMKMVTEVGGSGFEPLGRCHSVEPLARLFRQAVRLLCRFLTEAPQFESARIQKILPWLVGLHSSTGLLFLQPFLYQALGSNVPLKEANEWLATVAAPPVCDTGHQS